MKAMATLSPGRLNFFFALCLFLFLGTNSDAQASPEHHARVELIAEKSWLEPGRTLWVGFRFDLDPGWHIYWVNPGDSGEPPRVNWELPAGFRAGAIRWPYPIRLGRTSIVDYGYEGQVLLMSPIETPAGLKAQTTATVTAIVKWLACREICIPDQTQVRLSLPVRRDAAKPAPEWRRLFQHTRRQLPRPAPSGWKAHADSDQDHFILTLESATPESRATFFPLEAGVIENTAPQTLATFEKGVRLTLKKSEQLVKPVSVLKGVLVVGSGRAFEIAAPVVAR